MSNNPFASFIELISFDQKLIKIEKDIKNIENEILSYENEINIIKSDLNKYKSSSLDARKIVDEQELRMKELDSLEKEKKQKLDIINSPKEYTMLKKEIEKIKQDQYNLEPSLIQNWNHAESEKKEYEAKKNNFEKRKEELENKINENKKLIDSMQNELKNLIQERENKEKSIPSEWITKYNVMRLRVNNPVVEVHGNSCSACFYHITSQDLIDLKHKKLLECKRCYRFLFIK